MARINPYTPAYAATFQSNGTLANVLTLLAATNAALTIIQDKTTSTSGSLAKNKYAGSYLLTTSSVGL